jgi:L,D-peptidoglycan transpeptidase YkuD (ErfK/YbiS/YcfS/YnhG family)
MEFGFPIVSGSQVNRGGYDSAEVNLNDAADSFGQTMKADFILAVTQTPDLKEQNLYSLKVAKTRFGNNKGGSVCVNVDIAKQRISDLNDKAHGVFEFAENETKSNLLKISSTPISPAVINKPVINDDFTINFDKKKNVSDNETVKETASSVIQQETVRLSTQETTTEQITESETALEETKTSAGVEIADYSQISDETAPQTVELDNNSFAAGYSAASQYSQLVIVQSHGTRATVTMHELQDGVWTEILRTDGFVGSKGVGEASEYTSATPQGTFPLYFAFGINPDPGTKVPYLQVDEYDYWVGDSSSPLYNQYARADSDVDWDKSESERIIDYPSAYGYCLFIGYNIEGTPHMGSCYFLHCSNGRPTAGCVSVSESDMAFILRNIGEDCGIVLE